jgi:hypothetical protein
VLAVGDSYTFGWLLREEDTYVALLQKQADQKLGADRWQFLNGGGGGWGAADYVAYVEDFGERIRPRLVVVFLNSDDVIRSTTGAVYRLSADGLALEPGTPPKPSRLKLFLNALPLYQFGLEHSHLLQVARKALLRGEIARDEDRRAAMSARGAEDARAANDRAVRLVKLLFVRLRDWCERHGARLVVLTTGFAKLAEAAASHERPPTENEAFLSEAAAFFAAERIAFHPIDDGVTRDAGGDRTPYLIPGNWHPNESGAALIARNAWAVLSDYLSE